MKKIVIFGATSAIAQSAARIWASEGHTIILCAREPGRASTLAQDLMSRGAKLVHTVAFDASTVEGCSKSVAAALSHGCDIALVAHGILTDQIACQSDAAELALSMQLNFVSYCVIAEKIAAFLEQQRSGTLALISSVAGDRGRASNYLYGSAKAGVTALASGLRGRLDKSGVNVVTFKPGFVDTPMTAHLKKGALFVSADVIGRIIVKSIGQRHSVVYAPWFWRFIMGILAHLPERIFHKLPI